MDIIISIFIFIIGTCLGSFYNVVGYRIPKGESIVFPASHCPKCNHKLGPLELIPIISYIFLKGKCKHCHTKVKPFYLIFELLTGILFTLSYIHFGLSKELIISLTFISLLIIITISDYNFMIIPDSILITFSILLALEICLINGVTALFQNICNGLIAFIIMFIIKKVGDYAFKKESMGGGDIKLMFIIGLILGYQNSILTIFLASLIGLPISLITLKKNPEHIIPFGPFLAAAAIIILLTGFDFKELTNLLY